MKVVYLHHAERDLNHVDSNDFSKDTITKDGIKEGMAVITKDGLLGKISKSYHNSSEIKLITSDDTNYKVSVSIKMNDGENIAILNGYDVEKGLLKLDFTEFLLFIYMKEKS